MLGLIKKALFYAVLLGLFSACTLNDSGLVGWAYQTPQQNPSVGIPTNNNLNPNPAGPNIDPTNTNQNSDLPYDFKIDSISAMTCDRGGFPEPNSFTFTLSFASYYSGLRLAKEFKKSNNITTKTPKAQVKNFIEQSPFKNVKAQMVITSGNNLNQLVALDNRPQFAEFPPFNNPNTIELLSRLKTVYTSRSSSSRDINLSGNFKVNFNFPGNNGGAYFVNSAPSYIAGNPNNLLFALTYTFGGQRLPVYSSKQSVYGRGYKLDFKTPYKADYLIDIEEEILAGAKRDGSWLCPEKLRFQILRSTSKTDNPFYKDYIEGNEYKTKAFKENSKLNSLLNEAYCKKRALTRNERIYFKNQFGFDNINDLPFYVGDTVIFQGETEVTNGLPCVVFKRPVCYSANFSRVEFDPNKYDDCYRSRPGVGLAGTDPKRYKLCPAFLSVCYRDSEDSD